MCADFRERAFVVMRVAVIELAGERKLKHGVTEILKPLVVFVTLAQLVRDGRMRQGQPQQGWITKLMAEAGLKIIETSHGRWEKDEGGTAWTDLDAATSKRACRL